MMVCTMHTTALVFYEHLITLKHEIDFFIRRKWSTATWILICNRYLMVANVLFLALPALPQVSDRAHPYIPIADLRRCKHSFINRF